MTVHNLVHKITASIEQMAEHPLEQDEGVQYGSKLVPVRKALLCWMATRDTLHQAELWGAGLVLSKISSGLPNGRKGRAAKLEHVGALVSPGREDRGGRASGYGVSVRWKGRAVSRPEKSPRRFAIWMVTA